MSTPGFHKDEIPREHFSRNILARLSLTWNEEIWRIDRRGRGCYEDPCEDVHNKSCVSGP